jgi:hypothetical protein
MNACTVFLNQAQANAALVQLAIDIADETSRSDIELDCPGVRHHGADWYDTTQPPNVGPDEHKFITRAVHYLNARNCELILHHPDEPHLVRFPHPPAAAPQPGSSIT